MVTWFMAYFIFGSIIEIYFDYNKRGMFEVGHLVLTLKWYFRAEFRKKNLKNYAKSNNLNLTRRAENGSLKFILIEHYFWNGKIKAASRGCFRLIFGQKRWKDVIKQISLVIL